MAPEQSVAQLPEAQLNALLRRVDWRFLLRATGAPRVANLLGDEDSAAIELIGAGEPEPGGADVAVTGFPTRPRLDAALAAVRPGGEVVCLWQVPRLGGSGRAAKRLRRAGLEQVHLFWPGPLPYRTPQFWLPLGSPAAIAHLLGRRPAASPLQAALRSLWRVAYRTGLLAPLCAIGRVPGEGRDDDEEIERIFPTSGGRLLLSGGHRSINKVVGLSVDDAAEVAAIVKFSRVPAADAALDREAEVLRALASERPAVSGVPRLLAQGRRGGRRALAESAVDGTPLIESLTPDRFGELAGLVGEWLVDLTDRGAPQPRQAWWQRLVAEPLSRFEAEFGAVASPDLPAAVRERLERLDDLPLACEHRDCSPWNIVLGKDDSPGLLDWESAEPQGLPGLDLVYFLANAAFVLDGALGSGRIAESYARLLDPPTTPYGAIAARCGERYCENIGIDPGQLAPLRLLAWLLHSHSDFSHLEMAAAGTPSHEALRGSGFLGMIEAELGAGA